MAKKRISGNAQQNDLVTALDEKMIYDEWSKELLPELKRLVAEGVKPKDILKKFEGLAAARIVAVALTGDEKNALIAARDIQDRVSGKPVETKKLEHQFSDLTDEQLDAMIKSKLQTSEQSEENE
jgi:hypothetical protein